MTSFLKHDAIILPPIRPHADTAEADGIPADRFLKTLLSMAAIKKGRAAGALEAPVYRPVVYSR
jgi:hypothetical protein